MREYKFRGWHPGGYSHYYEPKMIYDEIPGECIRWKNEGQPLTIMQYTGLKDKNGKDIYEGDIGYALIGRYSEPKKPFLAVVKCDRCFWSYWEIERDILHEIWPDDRFEVIGDIYSNPELVNL